MIIPETANIPFDIFKVKWRLLQKNMFKFLKAIKTSWHNEDYLFSLNFTMTLDLITNWAVIWELKYLALLKSLINEWTYQIKFLKLINEEETTQLLTQKAATD